jgi:hypothetical protein
MPLTLFPALINSEAEANATKAISKVYSIKSWPDSSRQKRNINDRIFFSFYLPSPMGVGAGQGRNGGRRSGTEIGQN